MSPTPTGVLKARRILAKRAIGNSLQDLSALPANDSATCYTFGPFRLDPAEGVLTRDEAPIKLPPKALDLLTVLVRRPQRLATKAELLASVWPGLFVEEGNLTVNMSIVRRALDDADGRYIETVPKRGYRFVAPVIEVPQLRPLTLSAPRRPAEFRRRRLRIGGLVACALAVAALGGFIIRREMRAHARQFVVVMPFASVSPNRSYLAVGMAEAITERLARLTSIRVAPQAAVAPQEAPFAAARRLSADAVLTGSVEQNGDSLRVTAQLSSVRGQRVIFTDQLKESSADIFAVQDRIADRIATSLVGGVSDAERRAMRPREAPSSEAYDYYLRAREQWAQRTPESISTSIILFNRAIGIDSTFALAYAGLADAYNVTRSGLSARQRYPLARAAAERALALDDHSAEARTARAFQHYKFEWKWDDAEAGFREAIALDPSYALAHHWYAECLYLRGRTSQAVAEYRRAMALDPFSTALHYDLARAQLRLGDVKGARTTLEHGLALNHNDEQLLFGLADILAAEGRERESVEMRLRSSLIGGAAPADIDASRSAYARGGFTAMNAMEIAQLLPRAQRVEPLAITRLAQAYGRARNREQTLYWLSRAVALHEDAALQFRSQPAFDFLNGDPAFERLAAQAGLGRA